MQDSSTEVQSRPCSKDQLCTREHASSHGHNTIPQCSQHLQFASLDVSAPAEAVRVFHKDPPLLYCSAAMDRHTSGSLPPRPPHSLSSASVFSYCGGQRVHAFTDSCSLRCRPRHLETAVVSAMCIWTPIQHWHATHGIAQICRLLHNMLGLGRNG